MDDDRADQLGDQLVLVPAPEHRALGLGLTAPRVFSDDDDEGYGQVLGDGEVSAGDADDALRAAANCPERAVTASG